ncbi:MAG: rhodanese-like domain-containing protein, partial [Alphaproteobacteria bacterium]|nr:rhodanese-like domain-containing protein [Alphaproteobacteria bacterium]
MAQTITKGYQALLDEANSLVSTISVDEAAALLDSDKHV